MAATRTSSRRHRTLPARYQDDDPSSQSSTITTTTATTIVTRGRKRSRSPSTTSSRPLRRTSSDITSPSLTNSLESEITLTLPASSSSPALSLPPRITVPLDIDVTHIQLPSWVDMKTDYWPIWRHVYDKWHIQQKFSSVQAIRHGNTKGMDLAATEIDLLLYIREKLLTDHPERQDIDLRNQKHVKLVWRFLSKSQLSGMAEVAKFNCEDIGREMRWNVSGDDEMMWDQIGQYLIDQANEGRIYIDPRIYYNHYSWCIEDFGREVTDEILEDFYRKFATKTEDYDNTRPLTIDCNTCSSEVSTEHCECQDGCLLCLPWTEIYIPISQESSLPSPPRTPGTQPLPSYFKGRRLSHPPKRPITPTDDEAVDILLSFTGNIQSTKHRGSRPRRHH